MFIALQFTNVAFAQELTNPKVAIKYEHKLQNIGTVKIDPQEPSKSIIYKIIEALII